MARPIRLPIQNRPRTPIVDWSVRVEGVGRWTWLLVSGLCLGAIVLAIVLSPDPRGHGTHEQLGLPPCSFMLTSGLPCPTCGMTSAFTLVVRGKVIEGFVAQPAGAALCLLAIIMLPISLWTVATGRSIGVHWERLGAVRVSLAFAMIFVGAWGIKLLQALATGQYLTR